MDDSNGFKQTEIGLIPEEWEVVKLGEEKVAHLIMGQSPTSDTYNTTQTGLPFFQGKADFGDKYPKPTKWCSSPIKIAEPDDVLMSVRAPVGDVNLALTRCCIGRGLAAIRSNKRSHPEFLFYLLTQEKERIARQGSGTTFMSINKDVLKYFSLSLPPLPEQRAIAHVLSKIQATAEAHAAIADRARELKRALMAKLFTEGLHGEPLKETEIGPMPEEWKVVKLGKITKIGNGSTPKRTEEKYWVGGNIPWLTSGKVHDGIISQADEFVTETALRECHLPTVPKGSVVVAITGQGKTLGNSALLAIDACINQHLAYLTVNNINAHAPYILTFLRSRYEYLQMISRGGGSTKGALTCGFLKGFEIPLPPIDEQREIAHILQTVGAKIATAERKRAALEELFRAMLGQLMTGRVKATRIVSSEQPTQ